MRKSISLLPLALGLCVSAQAGDGWLGASSPPTGQTNANTGELVSDPEIAPAPSSSIWRPETGWSGGLADPSRAPLPAYSVPAPDEPSFFGLQWNGVTLRPRARVSATYDDNIFISNENEVDDFVYTISPGFVLGVGDEAVREYSFISLEYIPSFILFQDRSDLNSVDHHARLDGQWAINRLTLGGRFQYQKLSGAERDISDRVDRDIYTVAAEANYQVGEKTSVDVDGVAWWRDYERQLDSKEFVNHNWFNYHITPKVNVAAGVAFGVLDQDGSSDQTYQQGLVRLRYDSTAKLTFNGRVGVEFRQFDDSTVDDSATPVFGIGAIYQFSDSTRFGLNASRQVVSSATRPGENYTSTRLSAQVTQHIWSDLYFDVEGGYENADYRRAAANGVGQREDDFYFVRPGLTCRLKDWLQVSAYYVYRENDSNSSVESFQNNQYTLEATIGF